jgi:putative membrane protein
MFIIKLIVKWLVLSATVVLAEHLIPGITVASWSVALIAGLVLGLINLIVKPILTLITLPINWLTLGLFGIVLNAILFWVAQYVVNIFAVNGFVISSFLAALLGSILVSVVLWLVHMLVD